jgi:tetratricopeptide (TPR) repeat protein
VIYVGEPTSENVNFYGDPAGFTLPHSHFEGAVSQLWWQDKDPRDKRSATFPEITIEPTFRDYLTGTDPALEYALKAAIPETIQEALEKSLAGGLDGALACYRTYVSDPVHKYLPDPEPRVNTLGYKLLSSKRTSEAIIILEVNARTHPNSWNAYDSMGEAYVNARDKEHALNAYRKSLELNPDNANAKQMIERIESAK